MRLQAKGHQYLSTRPSNIIASKFYNRIIDSKHLDLTSFLDGRTEAITEYSETLVRRLIEKITVYDEKLTR